MNNSFTIVGNLGQDAEVIHTNGKTLAKINVAVQRSKDNSEWYNNLHLWDKLADVAAKYAKKGRKVSVTGYIVLNEWTDKNTGELKSNFRFNVTNLRFLDSNTELANKQTKFKPVPVASPQSESDYVSLGY